MLSGCGLGISDSENDSEYFPLQVGNTWVYNDSWNDKTYTEKITDIRTIKGVKYYRLETSTGRKLLRKDNKNQILQYKSDTETDIILYKLDAAQGTKWSQSDEAYKGLQNTVSNRNELITVPAGTYEGCLVFSLDFGWADYGFIHTLSKGIGRVKIDELGIYGVHSYELLYAEINGKIIGQK